MPPTGRRVDGQHGGRIRAHHRQTDDNTPTIGVGITLQDENMFAITTTEDKSMTDKSRRDYRNRLKRFIEWCRVNYPMYYNKGTRDLSVEEHADPIQFYHTNKRDLH